MTETPPKSWDLVCHRTISYCRKEVAVVCDGKLFHARAEAI